MRRSTYQIYCPGEPDGDELELGATRPAQHKWGQLMLGMVFTELLEMAEQRWSPALVDTVLSEVRPASGGAYTAVGYYPQPELMALLQTLAAHTGLAVPVLLQTLGSHLFTRFQQLHPRLLADKKDCFSLLASVDNQIHREVRSLYPEAELPTFTIQEHRTDRLVLEYHSARPMADLAEGLIRACIQHYHEPIRLDRTELTGRDGKVGARFDLMRF